jgi:hypothetical protein
MDLTSPFSLFNLKPRVKYGSKNVEISNPLYPLARNYSTVSYGHPIIS